MQPTCEEREGVPGGCENPATVMLRLHGSDEPTARCVECTTRLLRLEVLRGNVITIASEPAPDWAAMRETDPPAPEEGDPGPEDDDDQVELDEDDTQER